MMTFLTNLGIRLPLSRHALHPNRRELPEPGRGVIRSIIIVRIVRHRVLLHHPNFRA